MKLTPAQLKQYQDEGYTIVRGLIPRADTAALRARMLQLLDDHHDWPANHFHILDPAKHRNATGDFVPGGIMQGAKRDETFRRIADHPNLISVMEQILGTPIKRFTDQALIKHRGLDGQSFYHQDSYYWKIAPRLGCNSWIALDDVGKDAIALAMMPRSQQPWTLVPHEEYFDEPSYHSAASGQAFPRLRIPASQVDFSKEVILTMQPGDAALFTNYTWHRAESNRSGDHKCAYAVAYQHAESTAKA